MRFLFFNEILSLILPGLIFVSCNQASDATECIRPSDCAGFGGVCHNGVCQSINGSPNGDKNSLVSSIIAVSIDTTATTEGDSTTTASVRDTHDTSTAWMDSDSLWADTTTRETDSAVTDTGHIETDASTENDPKWPPKKNDSDDVVPDSTTDVVVDSDTHPIPDTDTGTDLDTDTNTETNTDFSTDTNYETDLWTDVDSNTDIDTATETDTATVADTETDTSTDMDTGTIIEDVLKAVADTYVRADKVLRIDDNYGCDWAIAALRGRDGYMGVGAPGATQIYIRFDIPQKATPVAHATLLLTATRLAREAPIVKTTLGVFRILPADDGRTPWIEGNGSESETPPPECAGVDDSYGTAWIEEPADTNIGRPDIGSYMYASWVIEDDDDLLMGDKVTFDITQLVNEWIAEGPEANQGLAIMITDWGEAVCSVDFGSRDAETKTYYEGNSQRAKVQGPRLTLQWIQ